MLQNCFSTTKTIKKYYANSKIIKTKYSLTHYQVITPLLHNVGKTECLLLRKPIPLTWESSNRIVDEFDWLN